MVRIGACGLAVALGLALAPAVAADKTAAFAEIDRTFTCPEALPDAATRQTALHGFMDSVATAAPTVTIPQMLAYRQNLLKKHACQETLRNIEAAEQAVARGDVRAQAWLPIAELSGVKILASANYLKPYLDPRHPQDSAVETFDRLVFESPRQTSATRVSYDEIVSRNVFYCRSEGFALIENDYFLSGRLVLKDASPSVETAGASKLYAIEPLHADTPNAAAARWACTASSGEVASLDHGARRG